MRILFLTQVLPYPLDAGPKMRAYYVLRKLAEEHQVTLLSFTRSSDPEEAFEHLATITSRVETVQIQRSSSREIIAFGRSLISQVPFLITRDQMKAMERRIEEIIIETPFEAIHADQLWMAPYALKAAEIAGRRGEKPLIVLDQHNAVHLIPARMGEDVRNPLAKVLLKREARLMKTYEAQILAKFDRVVWVTEEDKQAVQANRRISEENYFNQTDHSIAENEREMVIPICIDPKEIQTVSQLTREPVIIFIGGMHWPPNADGVRWFANEVLPLIQEKIQGVKFLAVGKNPPEELAWEEEIEAPGYVQDLEPFWQQSRCFIVPLRAGGGMRVKILDAWAHGMPVVSTTIGAEGIQYESGIDILIGDEPAEMAASIIELLLDDEKAMRLSKAGRGKVEQLYNWHSVYAGWKLIYSTNSGYPA